MTTQAERMDAFEKRLDEIESALESGDPTSIAGSMSAAKKARVVVVTEPAKLTDAKIEEISGFHPATDDDGTAGQHDANKDVHDTLVAQRDDAKAEAKPAKATKAK